MGKTGTVIFKTGTLGLGAETNEKFRRPGLQVRNEATAVETGLAPCWLYALVCELKALAQWN